MYLRQGKKKILSQFLLKSRLEFAMRYFDKPSLTVFNFHRLRENPHTSTEFDDGVFSITCDDFRTQLQWIKANTHLMSENDLLDCLKTGRAVPSRSSMITFDDGYADNYTLALPILKELGIPAIFFISTKLIEDREVGWWDLITYLVKKTKRAEISLDGKTFPLGEKSDLAIEAFQRRMTLSDARENTTFIEDLAAACEVSLPTSEVMGRECMTWDQILACANAGIAIGSHAHSHPALATLKPEAQLDEIARSKMILEAKLGKAVRSFAYPVGGYEHFTQVTKNLVRDCGYEMAFSYHTGINPGIGLDSFDIRRIAAPDETELYAGVFTMPTIFGKRKCAFAAPV